MQVLHLPLSPGRVVLPKPSNTVQRTGMAYGHPADLPWGNVHNATRRHIVSYFLIASIESIQG